MKNRQKSGHSSNNQSSKRNRSSGSGSDAVTHKIAKVRGPSGGSTNTNPTVSEAISEANRVLYNLDVESDSVFTAGETSGIQMASGSVRDLPGTEESSIIALLKKK